jgi:hypothetical protein
MGSSLHASQIEVDDQGGTNLYLVTETPDGHAFMISAIDADQDSLRWRRHIGLVCDGPPVAVGGKVLAWDRGGSLRLFDAQKSRALAGLNWRVAGRPASSDLQQQDGGHWLLPHADGQTVYVLAVKAQEAKIWKYHDGVTQPAEGPHLLDAPVAGTPALVGDTVVLPLAKGRLARLSPQGTLEDETWRSLEADKNALGHAAMVGPTEFACTDGSRGVTLWKLDGKVMTRVKQADVKGRILSAPALLPPPPQEAGAFRLCVADVGRVVTLFQGEELRKVREWTMSDAISSGPFVRSGGIGVIVGGRRLVWLNPDKDRPAWAHTFRADIVGQPAQIGDVLIVADESGQIQALDPATGQLVGLGYTLQADVAPAAAPVPFDGDRLFVPLTDGTVLVPSRAWFQPSVLGFPVVH